MDVNSFDEYGKTALNIAIVNHNNKAVEFLIENGASLT